MSLRDAIKADAKTVFANSSEFAESIEYHFAAGGSRSINAIIDREPPSFYGSSGNVVSPRFVITIPNDCNSGVLASEVDTGGDYITIKREFGVVVEESASVIVLMQQDMGMLELACK
jgi:hypothetical protein